MKKLLFGALALFMFISHANAYKPCDPNQVRKAEKYCVDRNTKYRACKTNDTGNITAICEKKDGTIIKGRADRAVPLRTRKPR